MNLTRVTTQNLVKHENNDLADTHNILDTILLLNMHGHGVNEVRQTEMHTAKP
jgi:hypothetical protein